MRNLGRGDLGMGFEMKRIGCYGSLKKGFFNHERFGNMEFVRNETIEGVQLYISKVPFPFAVNDGGSVEVEVYDVSPEHFYMLGRMEKEAGYYPLIINDMTIWVYAKPPHGSEKLGNTIWKGEHL